MKVCISLIVSVFLHCHQISVKAQGCTKDSCLEDFTSEFDRLESLLDTDVGLMASVVMKNTQATAVWQSCVGSTIKPNSNQTAPQPTQLFTTQPSGQSKSQPSGKSSTLASVNTTTKKPSNSTRLVIAIAIAVACACILLIGFCWLSLPKPVGAPVGNAMSDIGVGQFPPLQQKNPYVYQNRSFVPNFYT